jgi:hypothetical protein
MTVQNFYKALRKKKSIERFFFFFFDMSAQNGKERFELVTTASLRVLVD